MAPQWLPRIEKSEFSFARGKAELYWFDCKRDPTYGSFPRCLSIKAASLIKTETFWAAPLYSEEQPSLSSVNSVAHERFCPCTWVLKLKLVNLTELSEGFFLMVHTRKGCQGYFSLA